MGWDGWGCKLLLPLFLLQTLYRTMSATRKPTSTQPKIINYNKPERGFIGKIRFLIWRFHNFLQGTFSLGMLELWEQLLVGK